MAVTLCGVSNVIFRSFSAIVLQQQVHTYIPIIYVYMYLKIYLYKIIHFFYKKGMWRRPSVLIHFYEIFYAAKRKEPVSMLQIVQYMYIKMHYHAGMDTYKRREIILYHYLEYQSVCPFVRIGSPRTPGPPISPAPPPPIAPPPSSASPLIPVFFKF